jgi:hypothetical protein
MEEYCESGFKERRRGLDSARYVDEFVLDYWVHNNRSLSFRRAGCSGQGEQTLVSEELFFKKFVVSSFCRMAVNFEDNSQVWAMRENLLITCEKLLLHLTLHCQIYT